MLTLRVVEFGWVTHGMPACAFTTTSWLADLLIGLSQEEGR